MLERAERASHIDPPASSYAIMQRTSPYCGENRGPGKDVYGELDPTPGIREQPGSIASHRQDRYVRPISAMPQRATEPVRRSETSLSAISDFMHRSKNHHYSINSSAIPDSGSGTVSPSAFAVLRLMVRSTLVACCTGRSVGFSPLRIRPVYAPT